MRLNDGVSLLSLLPADADNLWQNNATSYAQGLDSTASHQYAVWCDTSRHPLIGQCAVGGTSWTTLDLTTVGGLIGADVALDGHNVFAVAADADGYIHVSGNMHGDWLRYARSDAANSVAAFTNRDMIRTGSKTGTDEGLVSYPRFIRSPADGELLFLYRNGASGLGALYLNRYDTATQTWSRVATLVDGTPSNESPYENRPVWDSSGVLHLSWSWAPNGGSFNDRNDVCYMRSADGGTTWTDIAGNALTLPVTRSNEPKILDTAASDNGMLNQSGMDVDSTGRPHIAMHYATSGDRNIYHLWWDGSAWQMDAVTSFAESALNWETVCSRPAMLCYGARQFVVWRHQYEGWRGYIWMSEVTDGMTPVHFAVADMDLRDWEPTFDQAALTGRNELVMLVTRVNADDSAPRLDYAAEDWSDQPVGLLTIDMTRIDNLIDGVTALPRMPKT